VKLHERFPAPASCGWTRSYGPYGVTPADSTPMWNCQRPYSTLLASPPPIEDCMGCQHFQARLTEAKRVQPLTVRRTDSAA
jgi:hypothetical protein